MSPEVLIGPLVTAAVFGIGGLIAYNRFSASMETWKESVDERVGRIEQKVLNSEQAVIAEKVRNLEIDYAVMHQWKNSALPQTFERHSENILNVMNRIESDVNRRVERIERVLNGSLK